MNQHSQNSDFLQAIRAERQRRKADQQLDDEAKRFEDEAHAAGTSLSTYIKAAWHVLEPGRQYSHGWHIDSVGEHLEAVTKKQLNRLIINVPPGTMKSLEVNVFWQTWEWGPQNMPHLRFLGTSYKESLAKRDNIKARRLIQSDWYQNRWGDRFSLMPDQNSTIKYENNSAGFRAVMAFGSLTGERGDRVGIDDPLSVKQAKSVAERLDAQETFLESVPNRLVDPETSAIILVMQRLHENDPSGIALARNLGYEHLMLPMEFEKNRRCFTVLKPRHIKSEARVGRYDAEKQTWYFEGDEIPDGRKEYVEKADAKTVYNQDPRTKDGELLFPERFSRQTVERDKVSLGQMGHAGQNQQRPAPRGGGLFKRSYFKMVKAYPQGTVFMRGWDFAATDDDPAAARSASVKIGVYPDGRFIIAHCEAEHASPARVRVMLTNSAATDEAIGDNFGISIPQDPGQAGKDQAQQLVKLLAGYVVKASPESGDKVQRAEPLAAQAEAGNVDVLIGAWNEMFFEEVEGFPGLQLKDIVDAASRAFNALVGKKGEAKVLF